MAGIPCLFGDHPPLVGDPQVPWQVWITTTRRRFLPQPDLVTALTVAQEHNAAACSAPADHLRPAVYAVVLHHGHAWQRQTTT